MIITALIAGLGSVSAQDSETDNREKVQFGLKGGLNYSNVYDSKGEEFKADSKFGIAAGLTLAIPIGKYLGLQPEVLLLQKGYQASGSILGLQYGYTRTTTYIDVPVLAALKPSEFFTLFAGPQVSFLVNQRDEYSSSTASSLQDTGFSNDNPRKNIFGVTGGLDINLKHIILGARAGCDLQTNNGDGTSSNPRYKNMWFTGSIGYSFYK